MKEKKLIKQVSEKNMAKVQLMTLTAIFAALITVMTAYIFHIPVGATGGYIHLGDSIIYLAATFLPTPYAVVASIIGAGLADLLTAPMWVLPTIIIKALMVLTFTSKQNKIITKRNIVALIIGALITIIGYYIASIILYGNQFTPIVTLISNIIQALSSAAIFILIAIPLDKIGFKKIYI